MDVKSTTGLQNGSIKRDWCYTGGRRRTAGLKHVPSQMQKRRACTWTSTGRRCSPQEDGPVYGQGAATHRRFNGYALVGDPARRQARSLGGSGPAFGDDPAVPRTTAKRPWPRAGFEPEKNHAGRGTGNWPQVGQAMERASGRLYLVYKAKTVIEAAFSAVKGRFSYCIRSVTYTCGSAILPPPQHIAI